jgi:hypothetical protein
MKLVVLVGILVACACDSPMPVAPTSSPLPASTSTPPPVPTSSPLPVNTVTIQLTGQVFDGDRQTPVQGALISLSSVDAPGRIRKPLPVEEAGTITDRDGRFTFDTNLEEGWRAVAVSISRDGYDPLDTAYFPPRETNATLVVFPTLSLRSGESFEMRTFLGALNCGDDGYYCRRVRINALASEAVDVEVTSVQNENVGISRTPVFFGAPSERQITVAGNSEVWILALSVKPTGVYHVFQQRVTVIARRQ